MGALPFVFCKVETLLQIVFPEILPTQSDFVGNLQNFSEMTLENVV